MRNVTVGIGADMLMPAVYERFQSLFNVASRKSLLIWNEVTSDQAEVMVVDSSYSSMGLLPTAPCVVYVGPEPSELLTGRPWVTRLKQNYTVSDLIDVLDRAAVFLVDWKVRHGGADRMIAASAADSTQRTTPASEAAYQLTSWVALGAPFNTGACTKALALLASQPVTIKQLCAHADIGVDNVSQLLVKLAELGMLKQAALIPAATATRAAAKQRPVVSRGLIQRFSRWLRGEVRT
jgi:hypothetical protein